MLKIRIDKLIVLVTTILTIIKQLQYPAVGSALLNESVVWVAI